MRILSRDRDLLSEKKCKFLYHILVQDIRYRELPVELERQLESSASSAVNYTSVYTDSEPGRVFWGADEELSDGGSLWVIMYGYDGLLMLPVAPPSPDYIPGPEEPQTPPPLQDEDEHELVFIQPHDPNFMPEPIYPKYIPLEDEHILPAKEQPLPPVVSPTTESPGYVAKSDPEDDPEEFEDDETEDGPVNYPMDRGDDRDDDDGNSSAMPTPPSPLTSLSPPSVGERLAICTAPAALPLPPLPSSLYLPPHVDRRDDILESKWPPCKRLCLSTLGSRDRIEFLINKLCMRSFTPETLKQLMDEVDE
nr:hypothetical protein [Tanacetum cinerariifolium]